jgi:RNA polymerase sigma-70 factor, ECF subfamily
MPTMTEPVRAAGRPSVAFDEFFHDHYGRLLKVMYLATGDGHEAEDLAQEAFVRVYEHWERVRAVSDPAGYLYRVALNLRRSRLRRLRVAAAKAIRLRAGSVVDQDPRTEDRLAVREALDALPNGQREAVILVDWLGMTDVEAAEAVGVSPGALRTRLHRARVALRERLGGADDE